MKFRFISHSVLKKIMPLRHGLLWLRSCFFRFIYGMKIHPTARISFKARLDKVNPQCIEIDEYSYVAFDAIILSHDYATQRHSDVFAEKTHIGKNCFVGCGAIILPGIHIGDHVVIGAGSVVTKNVPSNTIVAGNPAKVLHSNIQTGKYGVILQK